MRRPDIIQRDSLLGVSIVAHLVGRMTPSQIDIVRIFPATAEFVLLEPRLDRAERSRKADEDDENQNSLQPKQNVVQNGYRPGAVVGGNRNGPHTGHDHEQQGGVFGPVGNKWCDSTDIFFGKVNSSLHVFDLLDICRADVG